jgi:hypothetical protein
MILGGGVGRRNKKGGNAKLKEQKREDTYQREIRTGSEKVEWE